MDSSFYNTPGRHTGMLGWVLSTDHKRIGLLYLSCMTAFFLSGMTIGLLMRLFGRRSLVHQQQDASFWAAPVSGGRSDMERQF